MKIPTVTTYTYIMAIRSDKTAKLVSKPHTRKNILKNTSEITGKHTYITKVSHF